jgi:hypothetical protein
MWKKGNSKKDDYSLANVIVSSSEYDNSSTGIATLMLDITTSKHLYIEWLRTFKEEKTKKSQSFIEAYIDYITQNEQVGDVDRAIWGNLYQAVREDANIYYVIPTGVASEYKEVSDDLDNIQKSFIDGEVYSTKYGKVKRGFLFQKVINSLIKAYPVDNSKFATPEDLENKALSPIILKHLISTTAIKDKGDILGYKLETDIKAKIQDYFRVSSGVVGGNIPNLGTLETLTNSTKVPCLRYFNLEEFPKQGSYPNWDNFMSQFRNASAKEVFMSWIYSIFKATNKGSQLMWLHDGGGSGKSSVIKALHHFLDNSLGSLNDNNMTSDFGLETVVGKRLVVNADCKKPSIIHSQLVHCLTTSDPVSVNKKHKSMYTSKLYSKVLICSNSAPNLHTSEYNQVRRMIYIRLNSLTLEDKVKQGRIKMVDGVAVDISNAEQFVGNLIKEFPAFMYDAKTCYEKLCSSDNIIFLDNNLMNDIETLNDSIMDSLQAHINKEYIVIKTTEAISKNKILVDFDELIFELELEFKGTQGLRFKVKELLNSVFKLDTVNHKTDIKGKKVRHIAGFDGQVRGGLCLVKKI